MHERGALQTLLPGLQIEPKDLLIDGEAFGPRKMAATCHDFLPMTTQLWTFVKEHGVELTNNAAEQAVRRAVFQWKVSFGTHSAGSSLYVERVLIAATICGQ